MEVVKLVDVTAGLYIYPIHYIVLHFLVKPIIHYLLSSFIPLMSIVFLPYYSTISSSPVRIGAKRSLCSSQRRISSSWVRMSALAVECVFVSSRLIVNLPCTSDAPR